MIIYKNPFMLNENYFVKTGKASTRKAEATASKGYSVEFVDGEWEIREARYYDFSLLTFTIVAKSKASIQSIIEKAVISAVLEAVKGGEQK